MQEEEEEEEEEERVCWKGAKQCPQAEEEPTNEGGVD